MHLSLNQVEHTARKAARGAGLLWGLAEDAGRAVRWLEAVDLPGASQLVSLLQKVDHSQLGPLKIIQQNGRWKAQSGKASPLIVGPSIADCANAGSLGAAGNQEIYDDRILAIENIAFPLLIAGFAGAATTQCERWIRLTWDQVKLYCCPDGLGFSGNRKELDAEFTGKLEVQLLQPDEVVMHVFWPLSHDSCSLLKADWEALESYAQLTYVKSSAASRMAGAGAGLNDND